MFGILNLIFEFIFLFLQENHFRVQDYTYKELLEGRPANVLGK